VKKTIEKAGEPEVEEFELGGVTCTRWFDADGRLHVSGPEEVQTQIDEYIEEFARLSAEGKPVVFADTMEPLDVASLPLKHQAMLEVIADESDKAHDAGVENPILTITAKKVNAKLKELRRKNRKG
jgi:hypothetical protein